MRRVKGFSLTELLIAMLLGSVVVVGVIQLFVANSTSYNVLSGQSRMQESARFALEFIGREVRQAGYRGCFSTIPDINTTLFSPDDIPYEFDLRQAITGFESTGLNTWAPALTTLLPSTTAAGVDSRVFTTVSGDGAGMGINLDNIISGTDVITTRNQSMTSVRLESELVVESDNPVVTVAAGWNEFDVDHLVMIHDCEKSTIFRVTDITPNLGGSPSPTSQSLTVGHDTADTDPTANTILRLAVTNTFTTDAALSAIESHTYFIAPGAGLNNVGNTPLSLWRKSGMERPVELVEGIENLQLMYGVDSDNDGAPNQYRPANLVADWRNVVMVRVSVVANSVDNVGAMTAPTHGCSVQDCIVDSSTDGLLRREFSQTFQLRNRG